MGSVLLVIYLLVAILLVVIILMQRNSGNALSGLGGGNGADSFLSARSKGNFMTRTTAVLATIFFVTAMLLSLYYRGETKKVESITDVAPLNQAAPTVPAVPDATAEQAPVEAETTETSAESAPVAEAPVAETPTEPAPAE